MNATGIYHLNVLEYQLSSCHNIKIKTMRVTRCLIFFLMIQTGMCLVVAAQQKQFKALLVTTTRGWHHESQHAGVLAIKEMGVRNFFDVVMFEDPNGFTDKYLEQFQVVIFLYTTGDIFDSAQQK